MVSSTLRTKEVGRARQACPARRACIARARLAAGIFSDAVYAVDEQEGMQARWSWYELKVRSVGDAPPESAGAHWRDLIGRDIIPTNDADGQSARQTA